MNTTTQRPTPETDAFWSDTWPVAAIVFARNLERERDEAREQIQMMLKHDATRLESDSIVGSCDCQTKTPEAKHHKPGCKYRLICERDEAREQLEAMREAMEVAHAELSHFLNIINESRGVDGWHLNGAVADWDEFEINPAAAIAKLKPFLKP